MKFVDSKLFGRIHSPESIEELLTLVKQHTPERRNVYFWRGQSNIQWAIHSSAYRRLKRTMSEVTEWQMQHYEKHLLEHATHQGYRYDNSRNLTDLELLAKLQHHGAATRLIDFSRSIMVGLWFACSSEPEQAGLLFGFHSHFVGGGENRGGVTDYVEVFKEIENGNNPIVWHPPVVSKRIASQNAQFLYSQVVENSIGSLALSDSLDPYISINISPSFKKLALKELSETFDIHHLTLFPDIDGFGYASSFRFDEYQNERW
ncbi:FRG domain-containing protein [Psychrobacter sp. GP33]|uniref:FRG domain-containing protein n=1 Tax=Psychrobacter sp. GP33 TaxID=2758709 RepID=UPI0015F7A287|nr:FRG domain-containing protein [Psychrobacter sp. GP33]